MYIHGIGLPKVLTYRGQNGAGHHQIYRLSWQEFSPHCVHTRGGFMPYSRRSLMFTLVAGAGALATGSALYSQPQHPTVEPRPSPNTPDPAHPWGLGGHDDKPTESKGIGKQN